MIFDRNYCPIARIRLGEHPVFVHPLERIRWVVQRWFYDDATAPHVSKNTLKRILHVADLCNLGDELQYRQALSDHGRIPYKIWARHWMRR